MRRHDGGGNVHRSLARSFAKVLGALWPQSWYIPSFEAGFLAEMRNGSWMAKV